MEKRERDRERETGGTIKDVKKRKGGGGGCCVWGMS